MGDKSIQKKQYILDNAKSVFAKKGFKDVTMQDIIDACQISRGGLYLYFESTKEIFREVLRLEGEEADDTFSQAMTEESTGADILALFLKEQKKEILNKGENLTVAIYEYFFANQVPKKENPVRIQFNSAVKIIQQLIMDGVETGEFICDDPLGAARNMMYVLEGLKVCARTMGITEETVNREILYMMKGLVSES
ncbi:MAG: TetR/AcrR family transcriptional regulator [Lachnospiraceae bacterium]|nr:TetR/AcrR family transcriptional regulator [Lachnospiraceae bacterium]